MLSVPVFFFFKQKTAYEMRISDWSSDVCSSDLNIFQPPGKHLVMQSRVKGRDCGFSSACSARFPEPGFLPLWPGTARKSCHHLGSPCWPAISGICSEPCPGWARSAEAIGGSLGGYAGPPVDGGRTQRFRGHDGPRSHSP